jgi:hypothetical protein
MSEALTSLCNIETAADAFISIRHCIFDGAIAA